MTTISLERISNWYGNSYVSSSRKQNSQDVKTAISKMHWEDKIGTYRTVKNVVNFAAPLLASLVNRTTFSAFSWVTPGITAATTLTFLIPHEIAFYFHSASGNYGNPLKRMAALAGNSALEATSLLVISTLARDYLYIPRYVAYPILSGTWAVAKGNLNFYILSWPVHPDIDVKIAKTTYV